MLGDVYLSEVHGYLELPMFHKFRIAMSPVAAAAEALRARSACQSTPPKQSIVDSPSSENKHHFQPIVWKLGSHRHFGFRLEQTRKRDIPWVEKDNRAIFVGALTGNNAWEPPINMKDEELCMAFPRCKLTYMYANSSLVDARLSALHNLDKRLETSTINGIELLQPKLTIKEQLRYKVLIMLEGNDVSSGLKWALLSNSVVMMQRPQFTSWALEELLEPWVHYVPITENLDDVEDKVQWVIDNDEYAQRIAKRGKLWIQDMVYHSDVEREEKHIFDELLGRYFAHFAPLDNLEELPVFDS